MGWSKTAFRLGALVAMASACFGQSALFQGKPTEVFGAAVRVARRNFVKAEASATSNEILIGGQYTGQEFAGKIECEPAGGGATRVSVVTYLINPPKRPVHITAPQMNGAAAQRRVDENALLTNLSNSVAYTSRVLAGQRTARMFLALLKKELATNDSAATASAAGPLTDASIVRMIRAGLADGVIISDIARSRCRFSLQPDDLIGLKRAGASDRVIEAMLSKH